MTTHESLHGIPTPLLQAELEAREQAAEDARVAKLEAELAVARAAVEELRSKVRPPPFPELITMHPGDSFLVSKDRIAYCRACIYQHVKAHPGLQFSTRQVPGSSTHYRVWRLA